MINVNDIYLNLVYFIGIENVDLLSQQGHSLVTSYDTVKCFAPSHYIVRLVDVTQTNKCD